MQPGFAGHRQHLRLSRRSALVHFSLGPATLLAACQAGAPSPAVAPTAAVASHTRW
jgi:hypothetical protein